MHWFLHKNSFWWAEVDSNHRSRRRQIYSLIHLAALESAHIYDVARFVVEPVIGLEPTTCWLQISCSANWATPASASPFWWCLGAESNHRQADFQSAALPTELPRQVWRPRTGSNRRPPAWQAGALTNWATGPLLCAHKQVLVYNNLFQLFCQAFFLFFT